MISNLKKNEPQNPSMIRAWIMAARPKTLTAAVVPILAATALAASLFQKWSASMLTCSMLSAVFIQIGTNLVNDAVDFKKGADTEKRIGPRRVTQSGLFTSRQVMGAAAFMFLLAILFGIPLVIQGGWPMIVVGLVSVMMGYGYTSGPFPLAYLGLGDLFVILFFGLIAVGGVFYLHTGILNGEAVVLGLQVGFLSTVLIAINNLRDVDGDQKVGKRTLAVRFGRKFVRREIALLLTLPFMGGIFWFLAHQKIWAFILPLLAFPFAVRIAKLIFETEPSPVYNKYLGMSALVHILFGLLFSLGVIL